MEGMADEDVRVRDPVTTPSGDVAIGLQNKMSTEKLDGNPFEEKLLDYKSQEGNTTVEKSLEKRQFEEILSKEKALGYKVVPETESDINLTHSQIVQNGLSDDKILDTGGKVAEADTQSYDGSDGVSSVEALECESPGNDDFHTTGGLGPHSSLVNFEKRNSDISPGLPTPPLHSSAINVSSSGSIEGTPQESTELEKQIDHTVSAVMTPVPSTSTGSSNKLTPNPTKKSTWRKITSFLTLGLGHKSTNKSQRKKAEEVPITAAPSITAQIAPVATTDLIQPSMSSAPSHAVPAAAPHNTGRPLFSGSRFKLGLMAPKPKLRSRRDEKGVNWLETYEHHLFPAHQRQAYNLTAPECEDNSKPPPEYDSKTGSNHGIMQELT